jgi:hypothetical protein
LHLFWDGGSILSTNRREKRLRGKGSAPRILRPLGGSVPSLPFFLFSKIAILRPVRLAYQLPASSTFLSEQTSQQYFSLRTNQHQPSATSQTNRLLVYNQLFRLGDQATPPLLQVIRQSRLWQFSSLVGRGALVPVG